MISCNSVMNIDITNELFETREKRWRKRLPDEFKQFIKQNNGGIPNSKMIVKEKWKVERFLCIVPKISESHNGQFDIDAVITKYDEYMVFDEDSLGVDLIPFAQLNHDSLLCLCYKEETPCVVVWEFIGSKEFNPNYIKCYENFSDFINAF